MPATWASTSECVVVFVVPAGPAVGRGLRPALGGVLPLLLAAVWGDVEEVPGRPERLVATGVDEVRAVDLVAVAQEHVRAVPLRDVVPTGDGPRGDQADPSEPSTARIALCPLKIDASRPARVGTWVAASTGSLRRRPARRSRRCSARLRAR